MNWFGWFVGLVISIVLSIAVSYFVIIPLGGDYIISGWVGTVLGLVCSGWGAWYVEG